MIDPSDPMWKAIVAERDSLRARVLQMHAANSELLHDAEGLRAQLHLANVDAANREAEANDLRAQLAAAQRVPADAELDAIVDDIVTESAFCDGNGWSRTSLMLERAHESITALRRRVAAHEARTGLAKHVVEARQREARYEAADACKKPDTNEINWEDR